MPGKALNRFQSLWGGCQFLVTERKDVEDCLAGGVEGAMSESIFSEQVSSLQNVRLSHLARSVYMKSRPESWLSLALT